MPHNDRYQYRDSFSNSIDTTKPHRRSVILFCASTFFFWAALYLYVPTLPVYAQSLGASLSMVGIIVASYGLPQLLFRIPIGIWFDALNKRKPLVAGGIILAIVGALGLGLAPTPWFLTIARFVTGMGAATWVTFAVYFTAFYPKDNTSRTIGIINFVHGSALVVATSCGGLMAEVWSTGHTFFGAVALGIIGLLALLFSREPVTHQVKSYSWQGFTEVATNPLLLMASGIGILILFANFAAIHGFTPLYATSIGATKTDLGIITMLVMASSAVVSLAVAPLAERLGNRLTIILGAIMMGIPLLATPSIASITVLMAVQVANGMGRGILGVITMALSIKAVPSHQRATAMGVYQALYSIGMMLGPLYSGFLAESQGLAAVFYLSAFMCLLIIGVAFIPILRRY
ncbi:MFS transporter [Chloroflexota bacterium]